MTTDETSPRGSAIRGAPRIEVGVDELTDRGRDVWRQRYLKPQHSHILQRAVVTAAHPRPPHVQMQRAFQAS
jgi:hypothetical protein